MQDERTFRASFPLDCFTDWEDARYTGHDNTVVIQCASNDLRTQVLMIRTDGTMRVLARSGTASSSDMFWAQPLASPSADGRRISFNSNQSGTIDQHILFVAFPEVQAPFPPQ